MNEGISQSLTMLSLFVLPEFLLINTLNFLISPLTYFFSPSVDYEGLAPFVRKYLE